jgi:hypothetical protein
MPSVIDTHYVYRPKALDAGRFRLFVADVRSVMEARPAKLSLCGFAGEGEPLVDDDQIVFNGDARLGAHCEPLVIQRVDTHSRERDGEHFTFCKTNGKPYDAIVVAVLYALIHRFPNVRFVSDSKLDELKDGFDLFFHACRPDGNLQTLYRRPVDRQPGGPSIT